MIDTDQLPQEDSRIRMVDRGDDEAFVVDLGPTGDATVDVVGDTAIVVADGQQYDLDLPRRDAEAFIRNGVLTVTTEDSS